MEYNTVNRLQKIKIPATLSKPFQINNKILLIISLCYLYVPLLLFFATWTKWWIALLVAFISFWGCKNIIHDFSVENEEKEALTIKRSSLVIVSVMLLGIGVLSGWGGWCPQAGDWAKHNDVLNDLVQMPWPVYYKDAVSPSMLTYYIGQYLVPGAFGKITFSFHVAEIAMYLWGEIGLFLIVFNLFTILNAFSVKKQILVVIILVFFSGCLILSQQLYEIVSGDAYSDLHWMTMADNCLLQYRSNFVTLRWVMPQSLAVWLVVVLWWKDCDKIQNYVVLMIPTFLNGALSFLGLAFIAVICALVELFGKLTHIKEWISRVFSKQNILSIFVIGGPLFFYYFGNVFSSKPESVGFSLQHPGIGLYISFIIAHFGIHCFLLWKTNKNNGIFIGAVMLLLFLPFFHLGQNNDLVMCCSIPGLFVVMICTIRYMFEFPKTAATGALVVLLFIGAINPLKEMRGVMGELWREGVGSSIGASTLATYSNLKDEDIPIIKYNYYSYNIDKNIFIKYIAKHAWE